MKRFLNKTNNYIATTATSAATYAYRFNSSFTNPSSSSSSTSASAIINNPSATMATATATTVPQQLPPHMVPRKVPYFLLDCQSAFKLIAPKERLYAHHLYEASWNGFGAVAQQVSVESKPIFEFFFSIFSQNTVAEIKSSSAAAGVSEDDVAMFFEYFAFMYTNGGNYLSFGDTKFIPSLPKVQFEKIVASVPHNSAVLTETLKSLIGPIYKDDKGVLALGFSPSGVTSYYSPDITEAEVKLVNDFLISKDISMYNNRVFKTAENTFEVRFASADSGDNLTQHFTAPDGIAKISFVYGDYKENMAGVVKALTEAQKQAANEHQTNMISHYINTFKTGDINEHKKSQIEWVKDLGPVVETNIGFIESYRDPAGVRGEWEGFVAVVDKDQSVKYGKLVAGGNEFVARLPWGPEYEKDKFHAPDFTSLEVLTFASSGVPLGICIPNYDDIRENYGFKNVYLGNVGGAMNPTDKPNHLIDADFDTYKKHFVTALSVNVGIHELLGHGSGKLLTENGDGTFNFDKATLKNPFTGNLVENWYKPGESWGSKFGGLANAYEECRAEAVSLYLGVESDILEIFGKFSEEDKMGTIYILWLQMVRAGLVGLEMYCPENKQWRQAHMRARFCILQILLRSPNSIVKINHDHANKVLEVSLDADRIKTDGHAAIGDLIRYLNIYKAMGDVAEGTKYFEGLTVVDEEFEKIRETVMALRKPRRQFVQHHSRLNADKTDVELIAFEPSVEGVVESFVTRHKDIPL